MVIIISGATRGIGKLIFNSFFENNYEVYGTYLSTTPEGKFSKIISKVDVSDPNQVVDWVKTLPLEKKKIVLINAAGINYNAYTHKSNYEKWKRVIEVNLIGPYNLTSCLLKTMREAKFGRIINFSSVVPIIGVPGTSAYAASKSGLWGLSRTVALENATFGITINNLNLGYFDIGMIDEIPKELKESIIEKIPTKTLGKPQEILRLIDLLIQSEYITGESINVNGGLI